VEKKGAAFIVQVCDINVECICRENEGYWVKIVAEAEPEIIETRLCEFG